MVRPKKKSKRISAAKRYKIEKKVKEHHRKKRKEAKRSGKLKQKPKDPGIPNMLPFKEDILQELQERKQRAEEVKLRQKQQRRHAQNRQRSAKDQNGSKVAAAEPQKIVVGVDGFLTSAAKETCYRHFQKMLEVSDIVLEVLDARDPLHYRCAQVEQAVLQSPEKRLVLVLNKIDLIPQEMVSRWLKYLQKDFPTVAMKSCVQHQPEDGQTKGSSRAVIGKQDNIALGSNALMKLLSNYCQSVGKKTVITVGIVGFPNSGKSSVINSLERHVRTVGAISAKEEHLHLSKDIRLLRSPAVVFAKSGNDSSSDLLNCVKLDSLVNIIPPMVSFLRRCDHQQVMECYCAPEFNSIDELLAHMARRSGKLRKGGVPDNESAARSVLNDWRSGKVKFFTQPPKQHSPPSYVSTSLISSWTKEFDVASLKEEEQALMQALPDVTGDGFAVSMKTAGPVEVEIFDKEGKEEEDGANSPEEEQEEDAMEVIDNGTQSVIMQEPEEVSIPVGKKRRKTSKTKVKKAKKGQQQSAIEGVLDEDADYDFATDFT